LQRGVTYSATSPGQRPDGCRSARLLESFATGLDLAHPIEGVLDALRVAGFTGVTATSIGEHVWRYFDRWIAQTEYRG
jgi:hypothetical protein